MKITLTLLAAILVMAGNAFAQAGAFDEQTAEFFKAPDFTSPEAVALKDQIIAQESVSRREGVFASQVLWLAEKMPTSERMALLASKGWDNAEIAVAETPEAALVVLNASDYPATAFVDSVILKKAQAWIPSEFSTVLFNKLSGKGVAATAYTRFFKAYRATLPASEWLAVTKAERDALLNTASRSAAQNAFLTELTADLLAKGLDQ